MLTLCQFQIAIYQAVAGKSSPSQLCSTQSEKKSHTRNKEKKVLYFKTSWVVTLPPPIMGYFWCRGLHCIDSSLKYLHDRVPNFSSFSAKQNGNKLWILPPLFKEGEVLRCCRASEKSNHCTAPELHRWQHCIFQSCQRFWKRDGPCPELKESSRTECDGCFMGIKYLTKVR